MAPVDKDGAAQTQDFRGDTKHQLSVASQARVPLHSTAVRYVYAKKIRFLPVFFYSESLGD